MVEVDADGKIKGKNQRGQKNQREKSKGSGLIDGSILPY